MAMLFDCHSMPHDALGAAPVVGGRRPNLILGDRFGAACERWLIDAATDIFAAAGFVVARNAPFAGGYITQTYGRPQRGVHALQIEIDRSLYMDEARIERRPDFAEVAARRSAARPPSSRRPLGRGAPSARVRRRISRRCAAAAKKEAVHEARPKFREETPVGRV